jgi:ubiquinone/menaquinone biosynthesis C-methylase UbiE
MANALGGFDPKATYSAAAAEYHRASQQYWQLLSTRTIERLHLQPGQSVLDAACGTAPATIAAARRVGPQGRVVGVDYAEGMLAVARQNIAASGTTNVELVQGDMLALPYGPEFDAVLCVLGIFFVPDMSAAVGGLWRCVRPGGTLAITTFGEDVWEPVLAEFLQAAGRARPDIERVVPWRRIERAEILHAVFAQAGVSHVRVEQQTDVLPFQPEDWTTIVMGSGLRRMAVDLGDQAAEVIGQTETWARDRRLATVRVSSLYATAVKA